MLALEEIEKQELNETDDERHLILKEDDSIKLYDDPVIKYLNSLLIQFKSSNNSYGKNFNKLTIMKGIAVLYGSVSGVPYIATSKKYAGSNTPLSVIYIFSELTSDAPLTAWLFLNIINYNENTIMNNGKCYRISQLIVSVSLAALAALPSTIVALLYNKAAPLLAIISFANDLIGYTFAFNHFCRESINFFSIKYYHQEIKANFREIFISRICCATKHIMISNTDDLTNFLQRNRLFDYLQDNSSQEINLVNVFSELLSIGCNLKMQSWENNFHHKISFYFSTTMGFTVPLFASPVVFKLVFNQFNQFMSAIPSGIIAGFSTIPVYIQEFIFNALIFNSIYNITLSLWKNNYQKNFPEKWLPKTWAAFLSFGIAVALCGFTTRALLVDENFHGIIHNIIFPVYCAAGVLYKLYATTNCYQNAFLHVSQFYGADVHKIAAKFSNYMDAVKINLEICTFDQFDSFMNNFKLDELIEQNKNDDEFSNAAQLYKIAREQEILNTPALKYGTNRSLIWNQPTPTTKEEERVEELQLPQSINASVKH